MGEENEYDIEKHFAMDAALKESLSLNHERVSIIKCDASTTMFVVWFHISCYFPVFTACLGPIANTISIACVVDRWRLARVYQDGVETGIHFVKDPPGIFAFNVISLVLGFAANIVLLLHFSEKLSYVKAQCICIVGWAAASFMLLIDVIVCASMYFDEIHEKSIGFWYAVITSGLYFGCTITLSIHFIGYLCGAYPAKFNLLKNERSLMVFTVCFSIILIWGGGMFSRLLNISFGNSLYFCVVSILTVGLGDVLPITVAARVLTLLYSYLGVVNLALIVAMTSGIIKATSSSVVFFHNLEVLRVRELARVKNNEVTYTYEEAFNKMNKFRSTVHSRKRINSLLSVLLAFVIFWNLGSVALKFAEDWSYFDGIYFCFLCLITIGYGDYAPASGAGRAVFVLWGLGAIPLMSAIISTLGEILLDLSESMDLSLARNLMPGLQSTMIYCSRSWQRFVLNNNEILPDDDPSVEEEGTEENDDNDEEATSSKLTFGYADGVYDSRSDTDQFPVPGYMPSAHGSLNSKLHGSLETNGQNVSSQHSNCSNVYDSIDHEELVDTASGSNAKFSELRRLVIALKKFRYITRQNKKYCLTFKQWNEVKSLNILSPDPDLVDDPLFWLSEHSPLRFPMNQPKFVVIRLLCRIEELITNFLKEQGVKGLPSTKRSKWMYLPPAKQEVQNKHLTITSSRSRKARAMSI